MSIYSHRLELIKKLLELDYKVIITAPHGEEENKIKELGCVFIPVPIENRGTSIKKDFRLLKDIRNIYRQEKPDIILTFYTKTNIYGGIVARNMKIPYIENVCGLGTSLIKDNLLGRFMRLLYKEALKKSHIVFFQNKDNIKYIREKKVYKGDYVLLPGSGVSLSRYSLLPYPRGNKIEFLFCSRIIKEKGIDEYLTAARLIKSKYPDTIFHVAGPCDSDYEEILRDHEKEGIIKYHGKLMDLHPLYEQMHCLVLPSYYPEGMANVLLESAASGRPIITTNLPGCGETVNDNESGFIVKERDVDSLVNALEKFILLTPEEKETMGAKGREKMEKEFNRDIVLENYICQINKIIS